MARNRREYREEPTEEKVLTVDEALTMERASVLYEKLSEIVKSHGVDLLLKIRLIHSDYRTAGFVDDINSTDEVQSFIENPEGYLKSHYGEGSYRIDIIDGISKKYISHLKIDISSPKEKTNRQQTNITEESLKIATEINKARRTGREELLEIANLIKPTQNEKPDFDMVKFFELMLATQDKEREREERARQREDKNLEKTRADENCLREKELQLLERAYSNTTDITAHMKPFLDSMSIYGKMLSNSIGMVERALDFKERFNAPPTEGSFLERLLLGLGDKLINSNPQLLDKLTSNISQMNNPKPPASVVHSIAQNNATPTKTNSETPPNPQTPDLTTEQIFFNALFQRLDKGNILNDPESCAFEVLSDLEYFEAKEILNRQKTKEIEDYLISPNFIPHLETMVPGHFAPLKPFLMKFQHELKKALEEPQEETQNTN